MEKEEGTSSWNHRVMAKQHRDYVYLEIHEVYYKNDIPTVCTENPVTIGAESIKSLKWTLKMMTKCLSSPILWYGEKFPNEYKEEENDFNQKG